MKNCPYCENKISYSELFKHSFGKGTVKYDSCTSCGKTYKITMSIIFLILLGAGIFAIIILGLGNESRGIRKITLFAALLATVPIFPFFMKLSKTE